MYPTYELLGWYASVDHLSTLYTDIHHQWKIFNESPYFLQLQPTEENNNNNTSSLRKELPIHIYQSQYNNATNTTVFVPIPYKLEATESERITIDHVTTATETQRSTGSDTMARLQQFKAQSSALKVLAERLATLETFVEQVKSNHISISTPGVAAIQARSLLREIASVCARVPIGIEQNQLFIHQLQRSEEDSLLIAYTAALTKGTHELHEIVDKLNILTNERSRQQHQSSGGMMRGRGGGGLHDHRMMPHDFGYGGIGPSISGLYGSGMRGKSDPMSMGRRRRG